MVLKNKASKYMVLKNTSSWKHKLLKKAICEQFGIDFQSCWIEDLLSSDYLPLKKGPL